MANVAGVTGKDARAKRAPAKPMTPFLGQQAAAPTPTTVVAAAAAVAATVTPQPTTTPQLTATPIRAPSGAKSIDAGSTRLAVAGADRAMPMQIGNRPRAGMELLAVKVTVTNRGSEPLGVYRAMFRLS